MKSCFWKKMSKISLRKRKAIDRSADTALINLATRAHSLYLQKLTLSWIETPPSQIASIISSLYRESTFKKVRTLQFKTWAATKCKALTNLKAVLLVDIVSIPQSSKWEEGQQTTVNATIIAQWNSPMQCWEVSRVASGSSAKDSSTITVCSFRETTFHL